MSHLLYRCYAKVNLTLEVLGKRDDGYHNLASLVHTISLADDLRIDPASTLITRVGGLDIEPSPNLVATAAQALASACGLQRGAELTLVKRIPVAAGLGGGSSDAATTLVGLNRAWGCGLGIRELTRLGAGLGSDVPFFVRGGAALMRGRGDELERLPPVKDLWLTIVIPSHDVVDKTSTLYRALEAGDYSAGEATARAAEQVRQGLAPSEAHLTNSFSRAARTIFPGLSGAWAEVEMLTARRFFLSGAGPAIFSLATDRADARRLVATLSANGWTAFAAHTVKHARVSLDVAAKAPIGYP